jgi:exonuclease VII large subunit
VYKDDCVIKSVDEVKVGDKVSIRLSDGSVDATIVENG